MVADKQIVQDLMKELEKSLISYLSRHGGGGSKDPAAMLCEHLLNDKIMREEIHPQIVTSAPSPLQQTQTAVDDARTAVDDTRRTPQEQTQTAVNNTRRAALRTPVDDTKRRALSSLGVDVQKANQSTLLAATRELLQFLMDGNQSLALEAWNGRQLVVFYPKQSQTTKAFI
jgi:hypothetical protein